MFDWAQRAEANLVSFSGLEFKLGQSIQKNRLGSRTESRRLRAGVAHLAQERKYLVRQGLRNLIACLQFLSDRGAHGAAPRRFRVADVIGLVA
jgi:hypothetical protein